MALGPNRFPESATITGQSQDRGIQIQASLTPSREPALSSLPRFRSPAADGLLQRPCPKEPPPHQPRLSQSQEVSLTSLALSALTPGETRAEAPEHASGVVLRARL